MQCAILVLNAGSSSIKFAIFAIKENNVVFRRPYRGVVVGIGHKIQLTVHDSSDNKIRERFRSHAVKNRSHEDAIAILFDWINNCLGDLFFTAIGHRVVHGGEKYPLPVIVTEEILWNMKEFIPLAPLHQPCQVAVIETPVQQYPEIPQIACFDTAFHRTQPITAKQFSLPRILQQQGITRYGFHGLSYEYIAKVLPEYLGDAAYGRVIVAYLGHGASMCAMKARKSVATTMSFSPLDGLPMGTRCGALDPAVVLYLMKEKGMDVDTVTELLSYKSGLLGVSGISSYIHELLEIDNPHAVEAIDFFVYCVGRELGSLTASLGGLDALIFTAGIGEHSAVIRERICREASWLGFQVDVAANTTNGPRISTVDSSVSAWMIPTNEEFIIAEHAIRVVSESALVPINPDFSLGEFSNRSNSRSLLNIMLFL